MKIYIHADTDTSDDKTTFYKITLDDVIKSFESDNLWFLAAVKYDGFDAFDMDVLIGSKVVDGVLYYCDTNGVDIEVNGEMVDPEEALEKYSIDDLASYIKDASVRYIKNNLDDRALREFKPSDYNNWADKLMNDGYKFTELADAYSDIN